MRDALWGLVTIVIIMGGILSGVFTATESAAVACVYAFLVTLFVYRDYKWRDLPHLVHRVVKTVAMVMMLIGFSVAFGYMMTIMQIPAEGDAVLPRHLGRTSTSSCCWSTSCCWCSAPSWTWRRCC